MPKGVPKNGLWRGLEPLDEWLRRQEPRPCACGCGEMVIPKKAHRHTDIPEFIHRHRTRVQNPNYRALDKWVAEEQGKHLCACGCGKAILIRKDHHSMGIPRFIPNHHKAFNNGCGVEHPRFIQDRSLVKTRGGHYFTPAVMREIHRRCGGACVRCGATSKIQYDHVIQSG